MAQQPDSRKFLSELYSYLSSEGAMGNVSENDFIEDMRNENNAKKAYAFFSNKGLLQDADSFDVFYRPFQNVYASQKKSEVGTESSTTTLPEERPRVEDTGPEVRDGFVMDEQGAPMRSVLRSVEAAQVQGAAAPEAGAMPEQRPVPETPTPLMKPRTAETPAPIAPGQEAAFAKAEKERQAFGFPTQQQEPDAFGQKEADFPIKSANTAIRELEQARQDRQQGQRAKPTGEGEMSEIEAAFRGKGAKGPTYGSFFENTRLGRMLSQQGFGAGMKAFGGQALNAPELLANTMEDISADIQDDELKARLKEGKITQEQYDAEKKNIRQGIRKMNEAMSGVSALPNMRKLEAIMDYFFDADEVEDRTRENLQKVRQTFDNADVGFDKLVKEQRYGDAFQLAGTELVTSLPYMVAAMVPGGAYVSGAAIAQDKYRTIQDTGAEMNAPEAMNALVTGAIDGLTDAVGAKLTKQAYRLVSAIGREAAEVTLKQQIGQLGKRMVGASLEDMSFELGAQLAENILDKATIDPNKDITEGLLQSATMGFMGGAGVTAAGGAAGLAARAITPSEPGATTPTPETGTPTPETPAAPVTETGAPVTETGAPAPEAAAPAPEMPTTEAAAPTPGETAAAPTEPAAPAPTDLFPEPQEAQRMAGYAETILAGVNTEITPEEAQQQIDTYLESLMEVNEDTGEMVPPRSGYDKETYDEVMINRDKLSQLISQQSKQKADAAKEIEKMQPQGGEQQYPGAEGLGPQAPTETDTGDRPIGGGMQPQEGGQQEGVIDTGALPEGMGTQQPAGAEEPTGQDVATTEPEALAEPQTIEPLTPGAQLIEADIDGNLLYDGSGRIGKNGRPIPAGEPGTPKNPLRSRGLSPFVRMIDTDKVSEADFMAFMENEIKKRASDRLLREPGKTFEGIAKEMRENARARYKQIKALAPLAKRLGVKIYPGTPNETKAKINFGSFVYSGDKGFVYINAIRAQEKVLRHELAHVVMTSLYKINKAGTKSTNDLVSSLFPRVVDAIKSTGDTDLTNALQKVMDDFAENKKSLYQSSQYAEEYLVEFIARMDEGLRGKLLDNTTLGKIERAVNALLDSILGKGVLNVRFSNTQDLLDFLGAVSRGVSNADVASMDEALSMYAMGRIEAPVRALYWKKKEIKGSRELVKGITDRLEQGNYAEMKSAEGIVNEILAGVFGNGRYIVKFTGTQDAKGFFENIAEEIRINGQRVPSSHVVRAELLLAVNDYLQTITKASPQLEDDMSAEVKADMQAYYEKFPPVAGRPLEPTDAEKRMVENMDAQYKADQRSYDLYAEKVSVPDAVNQDNMKGLPMQQKVSMLQERTGNVPSVAAIQTAASPDPHGMYALLETVQAKMNALSRGAVDKKDVAKAAFAHAFGNARAHFQAVMDKVRVMDEAFISTAKEGGKNYYMLDGHGAASLLLNSESGQRFIENAANGQRNTDFERQVADVLQPFGVNATELFDKFYAAMQANETGGLKAAEKTLASGRSLAASILGLGDVSKKDAAALEKAIETGTPMAVSSTGIDGLDARADAIAGAVGMDKGVAREAMKNMVARHLTEEKDLEFFEDTLMLMDEEFYSQLNGRSDSIPDDIVVMNDMSTNPYGQKPYYKQARAFVWNEIKSGKSDKQIVDALQTMYSNGANGYDAREFFENVTGRKYRSQVDPVDEMMDSAFMFMRSILRLNLKEAGVAATVFRRTAPRARLRDVAYSVDFYTGNDLAFFRKLQRDVEKSMGSLMPKEMAGYQKMQLYISAAAFEIDKFAKSFYGDKKTTTASGTKDSFISRLTRSAVRSVNEFNTFLAAMHKQERMDRLIDIQERFLLQLYTDIANIAQTAGTAIADFPIFDEAGMLGEINNAINATDTATSQKIARRLVRFNEEIVNLKRGEQRKDKARQDFTQYLKSKGIANPATVNPDDLRAMPQFADHFAFMQEFKDMQKAYLDILREAGQLDDARYDHLVNGTSSQSGVTWKYYVPLVYDEYVYSDEMGLPNTKGERVANRLGVIMSLKKLAGIKTQQAAVVPKRPMNPLLYEDVNFEKPLDVLFHRMAGAIRFKHRNDAIRSVALTMEASQDPGFKIFSARSVPRIDRWGNPNGVTDLISEEIKKQSQSFYEGGKRKYIYFADPSSPILAKLKSGADDVSGIMQLFMSLNNIARGLFTYLRPSFLVANLFRDAEEAFSNIQVEGRTFNLAANAPGTPGFKKFKKQIIKAYVKRYGQSAAYLTKNLFGAQGDPQMNSYFRELQELGGLVSWSFDSMELIRDQMRTVEENINYAERYASGKSPIEATKRLFTNVSIGAIHKVSDKVESFARLATYAAMRDVGVEPIRAAEMAKNITVNFEKKGASKVFRYASILWLFLNPSVLGVRKSGKQLASPEGRKSLLWYAGVSFVNRGLLLSLPAMISWFIDDEEKEKEVRNDIETYLYSRYVTDTKMLIPNPLDPNNPLLLPKPFGNFRVAAAAGEGLADLMAGYKTPMDVAANLSNQLKGAMDPIAGTSSWANQYMEVLPLPILSPVFETMANSDHYGRAIVYDMSGSFDYLKANRKTPQIYRDIAKGLYMHTPNHIDISPSSIEHVYESYIGLGPAQFVKNSRDAWKDVVAEDVKSDKDKFKRLLVETAFINRVLYNDNISKEDKNDLYNYLSMSADPPGRWNAKKVEYAERAIALARDKELVNERVLQSSLIDLMSQVVQSGKLYQTVPGREITWEDWYMEQASPMGEKDLIQMSEALESLIEQTGAKQQK